MEEGRCRREICKFLFLIFTVLFLVLPSVSAITQINIYVDNIGDSLFLGETDENISLPEGVQIQDGVIRGYTSNLTTKDGDLWTFEYALEGVEMVVVLPDGAVVKSLSGGEIFLEKEQIAIFVKDSLKVEYTIDKTTATNYNSMLAIGAIILVALIVSIIAVIRYVKSENREPETKPESETFKGKKKLDTIESVLNEREKKIINKLKETGKIKSSFLRKAVDIPKASFSRHIQELEKKGLINRTGEGKNRFVELAE